MKKSFVFLTIFHPSLDCLLSFIISSHKTHELTVIMIVITIYYTTRFMHFSYHATDYDLEYSVYSTLSCASILHD